MNGASINQTRHLQAQLAIIAKALNESARKKSNENVTRGAISEQSSGWPRLPSHSTFPEPCLLRAALTARVSRSTALRAGRLSLLLALLALAPDALVLADASPAAILALAPDALVLAEG